MRRKGIKGLKKLGRRLFEKERISLINNSNPIKAACKIEIPLEIQLPPEFTQDPSSPGDHQRRRRLERGLYQKDAAVHIGVTPFTI